MKTNVPFIQLSLEEVLKHYDVKNIQLYKTNRPGGCMCGCRGKFVDYKPQEFNLVLNECGVNLSKVKFYHFDKANESEWKIPTHQGYYINYNNEGNEIKFGIKTGLLKDKYNYWKSSQLEFTLVTKK